MNKKEVIIYRFQTKRKENIIPVEKAVQISYQEYNEI